MHLQPAGVIGQEEFSVLFFSSLKVVMLVSLQREALKLSRKNDDMKPFEPGGETHLEHLARKADCGMFVLDSHTKKRPHNLILGRWVAAHGRW